MGIEAISSLALAAASIGGTIFGAVSKPSLPKIPTPSAPPAPPPPAARPPEAPTETQIGEGVAGQRRRRDRQFGLDETILAQPSLGGANILQRRGGRAATLGTPGG